MIIPNGSVQKLIINVKAIISLNTLQLTHYSKNRKFKLMQKIFASQRGAVSVGIAILVLITGILGVAAGYKAVQTPTQTQSKAQNLSCTDLTQYPKKNCNITKPGPCSYGQWKFFDCFANGCPSNPSTGAGFPYWCDGSVYHLMNTDGECTSQCQAGSNPPPTQPPGGGGGATGKCLYLTARLNHTQDGNWDAWVTFNSGTGQQPGPHIELYRDNVHVAGMNVWSPIPFTYEPQHTGGRIPGSGKVDFRGWVDVCGGGGTTEDTITCYTSNANGQLSVSGAGCSCLNANCGGTAPPAPTNTPIPPPGATNTPIPPPGATNTPVPPPNATPTPTSPTLSSCRNQTTSYCCDNLRCPNGYERKYTDVDDCYCKPITQQSPTPTPILTSCKYQTTSYCCDNLRCPNGYNRKYTDVDDCYCESVSLPPSSPTPTTAYCKTQACCETLSCANGYQRKYTEVDECHCERTVLLPVTPIIIQPTAIPRNLPQTVVNKIQEVFFGKPETPLIQPTLVQPAIGPVIGNVKINNTEKASIQAVYVTLFNRASDPDSVANTVLNYDPQKSTGTYTFNVGEQKRYIVRAWARTDNGNWYKSNNCPFTGDCYVKPGDKKNLTIDIGPQGLRYTLEKTQTVGTNAISTIKNIPVIGPWLDMFFVSAF